MRPRLMGNNLRIHAKNEESNNIPVHFYHAPNRRDGHPDGAEDPEVAHVAMEPAIALYELQGNAQKDCCEADAEQDVT